MACCVSVKAKNENSQFKRSQLFKTKKELEKNCNRVLYMGMNELHSQIDKFNSFARHTENGKSVMDLDSFKDMMGILGGYYLSERMFAAIDQNGDGKISLEEYINYFDILTHGTDHEKNVYTFKTLDLSGDGVVGYQEFKIFWTNFMKLYGEALQTKLSYDEALVRSAFNRISGGKDHFDFKDFELAKENNPEVFEWLEQPGKYVQEFGLENQQELKIEFCLVESFYSKVMDQIDSLKSDLEKLLGIGKFNMRSGSKDPMQRSNTSRIINKGIKSNQRNNIILEGLQHTLRKTGIKMISEIQKQNSLDMHGLTPEPDFLEPEHEDFGSDMEESICSDNSLVQRPIQQNVQNYYKPNYFDNKFTLMGKVPTSIGKHLDNTPSAQYETPVKMDHIKIELTDNQQFPAIREETKENLERIQSEKPKEHKGLRFQSYVEEDDNLSAVVTSGRNKKRNTICEEVKNNISPLIRMSEVTEGGENIRDSHRNIKNPYEIQIRQFINKVENIKNFINENYESLKDEAKQKPQNVRRSRSRKHINSKSRAQSEDIPAGGQMVRFGHQNFDLILNIMIGIKKSLSNLIDLPFSNLADREFKIRFRVENQWISNLDKNNLIKDFKFYDYAPYVFQKIRRLSNINEDDYINSLGPDSILNCFWTNNLQFLYELCSSGKSGSLFYYTEDQQFMLKTVHKDEFKKLKQILQKYFKYINSNPDSLITRFYGLHKLVYHNKASLKDEKKYLVVMNNVIKDVQVGLTFDLKGSTVGRRRLEKGTSLEEVKDQKIALKDLDFLDNIKKIKIINEYPKDKRLPLSLILEKDAMFFESVEVMDYSLLISEIQDPQRIRDQIENHELSNNGIYFSPDGKAYICGIIDILTEFNGKKRMEYLYKRVRNGLQMSCVPPDVYAQRFIDFMKKIFQYEDIPPDEKIILEERNKQQICSQYNIAYTQSHLIQKEKFSKQTPSSQLDQIEYAKEAVKQGSTSLGLKSDNYVVLASLKKSPHDLATHQEKIFDIDAKTGIAMAGLTADGRYLCKYMRNECLNYWYTHGSYHPTERLIAKIAKKSQVKTCHPSKRPFGVGLLVAGVDETGTHLFETCPSANYYEYIAMAIGARNQSAKTYLEKNYQNFAPLGWQDLVKHAVKALRASAQEVELTEHNVSIGVVGKDVDFRYLTAEELREYIGEGGEQQMDLS